MNILEFQKTLGQYQVFSLMDVKKSFPDFSYRQIDRWQKKGYIQQIRREYYCFADQKMTENLLFCSANIIYSPSYISLESALAYYGLIPEEVFWITSVTTKKTIDFLTSISHFSFRHVKPDLFWGYQIIESEKRKFLMAQPEKALLDFLYFHPSLKTNDDFASLRMHQDTFLEIINPDIFEAYLQYFDQKSLTERAHTLYNFYT